MAQHYLISHPDGATTWLHVPNPLGYDALRLLLDGRLEVVYPFGFDEHLPRAYGHEEARILGHPTNPVVTAAAREVYGYTQVGTFIWFDDNELGESVGLSPESIGRIKAVIKANGYPEPTIRVNLERALEEANDRRSVRS